MLRTTIRAICSCHVYGSRIHTYIISFCEPGKSPRTGMIQTELSTHANRTIVAAQLGMPIQRTCARVTLNDILERTLESEMADAGEKSTAPMS